MNSNIEITKLCHFSGTTEIRSEIQQIFFLSSSKKIFSSEKDKQNFWENWTKYYFDFCADLIYVARDGDKTVGYMMACIDSAAASKFYSPRIPSYLVFEDLFELYPAHLHINCHPDARGLGVGHKLMTNYFDECMKLKVKGLHIVTSPDQRNVFFYKKNGFNFELSRNFKQHPLLFMAKSFEKT